MIKDYYNRYDAKKSYKELLFLAGRGLQSAELNELQSYLREDIGEIASAIIKDGSLLEGGEIQYDTQKKQASLSKAKILHKKTYVVTVPQATIKLEGKGKETIGIAVEEKTITEKEDPNLRDPAVGYENYAQPGALRKQVLARWTKDTEIKDQEIFYPIYEFIDGSPISKKKTPPEITGAIQLLARYDYGANGSYVVKGLTVTYEETDPDTQEIVLLVSEGVAHVEGFEVELQYSRRVKLTPPLDTKEVLAEPVTFTKDGHYRLRNTPIAKVNRIIGVRQETAEITHGNYSGAKDKLPKTPVVDVLQIRQGSKVFTEGKDYIISGDYIDWSLSGEEPKPGSKYTVVYKYQDSNVKAQITNNQETIYISGLAKDTVFYVDYEYYLPRIDKIVLTREGNVKVLKGIASENPSPPDIADGLSLAQVKLFYKQKPQIRHDFYRAFKMSDIQALFEKIENIEYNIAKLSLIENARSQDPTTTKKNIFVDPFYDDDLRDEGYQQDAIIQNKTLCPAIEWKTYQIRSGKEIQLPYTVKQAIIQDSYTKERQINRFTWNEAPPAVAYVSPKVYRWINKEITRTLSGGRRSWRTETESIVETPVEVPQITVSVQGHKFNAGETVEIYFDGKLVKLATANSNGYIDSKFTIPRGTKSGNKQIQLIGRESKARATTIISLIPIQRTITIYRRTIWNDPIAQTFTPDQDIVPDSVELYFTNPPEDFVDVFICETQVGLPDRKSVLTASRLYKHQIKTNQWTKFVFDTPVKLTAGREYAIVVETTDSKAKVATAKLGEWDIPKRRWLTTQSYSVGVMLESANSSTWTPIQDEDLAFKLNVRQYERYKKEKIGEIYLQNATDVVLQVATENPSGTQTNFILKTPKEEYVIYPYVPLIKHINSKVEIYAQLQTENKNISPTIDADVYLSVGQVKQQSTYISRAFPVNGDTLKVYLECKEEGNTKVKVYYQEGESWRELTRQPEGTPVGDGFVEYLFKANTNTKTTRIKIVLQANKTDRSYARNLRAIVE